MGMHEGGPQAGSRQIDRFSAQVQRFTRARRVDTAVPFLPDAAGISLMRHNTGSLDRIASKLQRLLSPTPEDQAGQAVHARLWGSYLTVHTGSELLKAAAANGRSLREAAADERNDTNPKRRNRRHEALRQAFGTAIDEVLSEKRVEDIVAVAALAATTVMTADQSDMEVAASQIAWLRHQAGELAGADPELALIEQAAEGILDVVRPVLQRTKVLFAA